MSADMKRLITVAMASFQRPASVRQIAEEMERISGHPVNARFVTSCLEGPGMRDNVRLEGRRWVLTRLPAQEVLPERLYWCRSGEHDFASRTQRIPGESCNEHLVELPGTEAMSARDTTDCFLWAGTWYVRFCVTDDLLEVSESRVPFAIGDRLPLSDGALVSLAASTGSQGIPDIMIRRSGSAYWVRGMGALVLKLGCGKGDLLFLGLRSNEYAAYTRPKLAVRESQDAELQLAWLLGAEESAPSRGLAPWGYLHEAIGCERANRRLFRERLVERGQIGSAALVDSLPIRAAARVNWPTCWYVVCPLGPGPGLSVIGPASQARLAVALCSGAEVPLDDHCTSGGALWVDVDLASWDRSEPCVAATPDCQPIQPRSNLARWLRAEHNARLAGLSGRPWTLRPTPQGWAIGGSSFSRLVEALESIGLVESPASGGLIGRLVDKIAFPKNQWALESLEQDLRGSLVSLSADGAGFSAEFQDGSLKRALSLVSFR